MTQQTLRGENLLCLSEWVGMSTLLLVATLVASTAAQAQTPVPDVQVNGCVVRQPISIPAPPFSHEQEAARGLSLTQVTIPAAPTRRGPVSERQAFWLVGDKAVELARFVDRQAEVIGRFDERNASNPGSGG
jgi:hypothetical protein